MSKGSEQIDRDLDSRSRTVKSRVLTALHQLRMKLPGSAARRGSVAASNQRVHARSVWQRLKDWLYSNDPPDDMDGWGHR